VVVLVVSKTIIYTKTGCPYCAAAMDDMSKRGENYEERNCTIEPSYVSDVQSLSNGRVVPVIVRGEDVQVGFGGG